MNNILASGVYFFNRALSSLIFPIAFYFGLSDMGTMSKLIFLGTLVQALDMGFLHRSYSIEPLSRDFQLQIFWKLICVSLAINSLLPKIFHGIDSFELYIPILLASSVYFNMKAIESYGKGLIFQLSICTVVVILCRFFAAISAEGEVAFLNPDHLDVLFILLGLAVLANEIYSVKPSYGVVLNSIITFFYVCIERSVGGTGNNLIFITFNFAMQFLQPSLTIQNMIMLRRSLEKNKSMNILEDLLIFLPFLIFCILYLQFVMTNFNLFGLVLAAWITSISLLSSRMFFKLMQQRSYNFALYSNIVGISTFAIASFYFEKLLAVAAMPLITFSAMFIFIKYNASKNGQKS